VTDAGGRAGAAAGIAAADYVAAVNAGDVDRLRALLAEDAVLEHPAGLFSGAHSIAEFYRESVLGLGTTLTAISTTTVGRRCVLEVVGRSPLGEEVVHACDVFDVDGAGRIVSMRVYIR
jgi:ketosteroid isomerase-like protein